MNLSFAAPGRRRGIVVNLAAPDTSQGRAQAKATAEKSPAESFNLE
jgi:hypothetical protein